MTKIHKSVQQPIFNSPDTAKDTSEPFDEYKFELIQGYPMLHWKGKRPYRSTQYYPAQLKETHGDPSDGWFNRIYWGDNLQVMSHLLREFRGKVQLIYIDPPFDSKADYKKKVSLKGQSAANDHTAFEEKQYTDIWTNDEYLQFMYERLIIVREFLSKNGSIWFHCDWHKMHLLRCILDEVFGPNSFVNEIVWKSQSPSGMKALANQFSYCHETIFWYSANSEKIFNKQFIPYNEEYIKQRFRGKDERGRYKDYELQSPSKETLERLKLEDRLITTKGGKLRVKQYLDESPGILADSVWQGISAVNSQAQERLNYPTQKPEALLERIIKASSNPGDLVFDCFMGSGTTQAVAMKLGRRFIGADINLGAVQITTKRLLGIAEELKQEQAQTKISPDENAPETFYTGFSVYNVNHYEVFRNPIQAKELLIEALAIQPLPNSLYDGQKDGRMVKIMPINRIATRADLNELLSNFDYKTFEKRQAESPKKPVEKITLVCMGHEPDLAAQLEKEVGYKLDVDVVDILRDKSKLEFKRDSEALVVVRGENLVIDSFYPMNLLQKLSMFRENVEDWRELVESVMIDWNYDGAVFRPEVADIPEKNDLVKGVYPLPKRTGMIRVKITDLLSESWEGEAVANG